MAELIATSAFGTMLPISTGSVTAREHRFDAITSVAPLRGKAAQCADGLQAQIGLGLPETGHVLSQGDTHVSWAGLGQFFVFGPALSSVDGAAVTDQTDAWAVLSLEGAGAVDVLSRLTAIDLRPSVSAAGQAARAQIGHMNALILCLAADHFKLLVFRSMAKTAAHEVADAMRHLAARDAS